MDFKIVVHEGLDTEALEAVKNILGQYNHEQVIAWDSRPLTISLHDDDDQIVGGLTGRSYWGWLSVDRLAVNAAYRHAGYGTKLLAAAEREAVARGCHSALLDTFSFQALPFYERHGYVIFGVLEDYPLGHKRYFLQKRLMEPSSQQTQIDRAGMDENLE